MEDITEMEELEGVVENIRFDSGDGSFCVFRLRPDGQRGLVTVTVNLSPPLQGQQLQLKGQWVQHPRFGLQFKAEYLVVAAPTSIDGIEKFLASGNIEGVGPATAKKIVAVFGKNTLEIIERAPHRLLEVPKIGKKTAEKIRSASGSREASVSIGVTPVVKDVVAQRGMAKSGPIVRYRRQVKNTP